MWIQGGSWNKSKVQPIWRFTQKFLEFYSILSLFVLYVIVVFHQKKIFAMHLLYQYDTRSTQAKLYKQTNSSRQNKTFTNKTVNYTISIVLSFPSLYCLSLQVIARIGRIALELDTYVYLWWFDGFFRAIGNGIDMLQVVIAEACDSIAGCESDGCSQSHIPWNRATNNSPNQYRSQAEQWATEHAAFNRYHMK